LLGLLDRLRSRYPKCLTTTCNERGCKLRLDEIDLISLVIIHGSRYQKQFGSADKLCDRVAFLKRNGYTVMAIELKGGQNAHIKDWQDQIQRGLDIAHTISRGEKVRDWLPLLVYSGRIEKRYELKQLRIRPVFFGGQSKLVIRVDCGSDLAQVTSKQI